MHTSLCMGKCGQTWRAGYVWTDTSIDIDIHLHGHIRCASMWALINFIHDHKHRHDNAHTICRGINVCGHTSTYLCTGINTSVSVVCTQINPTTHGYTLQ